MPDRTKLSVLSNENLWYLSKKRASECHRSWPTSSDASREPDWWNVPSLTRTWSSPASSDGSAARHRTGTASVPQRHVRPVGPRVRAENGPRPFQRRPWPGRQGIAAFRFLGRTAQRHVLFRTDLHTGNVL